MSKSIKSEKSFSHFREAIRDFCENRFHFLIPLDFTSLDLKSPKILERGMVSEILLEESSIGIRIA